MGKRLNKSRWWLKAIAICASLGAISCVAMAWGLAWNVPIPLMVYPNFGYRPLSSVPQSEPSRWYAAWERRFGYQLIMIDPDGTFPDSKEFARGSAAFDEQVGDPISLAAIKRHEPFFGDFQRPSGHIRIVKAGWPFLCLGYEKSIAGDATTRTTGDSTVLIPAGTRAHQTGLRPYYSAFEFGERRLPVGPIWTGLMANVAIYTCVWFVLVASYVLVRHLWRKRRGLCLACGYSRLGLASEARCPECGGVAQSSIRE